MTTMHLLTDYNMTPEQVSAVMNSTITFTKPVEVLHHYKCTLTEFSKLFKPKKDESDDMFQARMAASWFTLYMNEGEGSSRDVDEMSANIQIDYNDDNGQEEEEDDIADYLGDDIIVSGKRAFSQFLDTLPEAVAKREADRAAWEKKKADEKRLAQVATLKSMLAELGEKV